ncbi:MAG TPA: DUF4160 domain-containing protein [Bacillales bacterium]|nr:DUF4160 domain-containing protein [Bacillales bacterium]
MPQICEFYGMKIYLYFDDHDPPHFHVRGPDKTRINIINGEYLDGDQPLPRIKEKKVLKWLEMNKIDMIKAWNACKEGEVPSKIPPLP